MKKQNKILIVDDNPTNIEILQERLEDYQLTTALSGEDALRVAPVFQPDLILLDIMLSGIDGYEVCRRLRQDSKFRKTKIIMVSGKGMLSERLEGYEAGVDDYITKPFNGQELLAKVRVYLKLKSVEEVDDLKTELLRLLCLDTVNPLSSIMSPLSKLMDTDDLDVEERNRIMASSFNSARNLQKLFEKVVLFTSIKSGKVKFNFALNDLCVIVRDAIKEVKSDADERNISFREVLPETALLVVDRPQIKRVVVTILDNAVRFSAPNGRVIVEISEAAGNFCLSVQDEGKGMDPAHVAEIYNEFTYMEANRNSAQWRGLSLPLAQLILFGHDGKIDIESKPGLGTMVSISIPKRNNSG